MMTSDKVDHLAFKYNVKSPDFWRALYSENIITLDQL